VDEQIEFSTRGGVSYIDPQRKRFSDTGGTTKYATWPFCELVIRDDEIIISTSFEEIRVTRTNLVSLSRFGRVFLLADGFRFQVSGKRDAVVFWAMRAERVLDELLSRGWPVRGAL
jgi:hypothetical protein